MRVTERASRQYDLGVELNKYHTSQDKKFVVHSKCAGEFKKIFR